MNIDIISDFAAGIVHEIGIGFVFLVVGLSFQRIRRLLHHRKFKRAFGFVVESGTNVAISMPFWTLKTNERGIPRFVKKSTWSGEEEEYYGPTETFSADDVKASRELSAVVSEVFPQPTLIVSDRDTLQFEDRTVLIVGSPIANFHARNIFQGDFFRMGANRPFVFREKDETTHSPSRTYVVSTGSRKEYYSDKVHDIGVVQRLRNPRCDDGYLFIVAASHAEGTFGAARYLRNNWKWFAKQHIGSTVGVLLGVDRSNPDNTRVLERYGAVKSVGE